MPTHAADPVRVRVRSCGICASDLHLAAWNLPVTLGHEFAGVLDDGTAVAVQPNVWCGECDRCRAGETQLCRLGADRLHGVSVDGGLADEVIVDRRCLVPLAPSVDPAIGALVEPLAVGTHAARPGGSGTGRSGPGDRWRFDRPGDRRRPRCARHRRRPGGASPAPARQRRAARRRCPSRTRAVPTSTARWSTPRARSRRSTTPSRGCARAARSSSSPPTGIR